MGIEKPKGNHPSHTENTISATIATQNAGVELSARHVQRITRSTREPFEAPAAMPSTTPRMPESAQAASISAAELANRSPTTAGTEALKRRLVPQSPCKASASHVPYRSSNGTPAPQCAAS